VHFGFRSFVELHECVATQCKHVYSPDAPAVMNITAAPKIFYEINNSKILILVLLSAHSRHPKTRLFEVTALACIPISLYNRQTLPVEVVLRYSVHCHKPVASDRRNLRGSTRGAIYTVTQHTRFEASSLACCIAQSAPIRIQPSKHAGGCRGDLPQDASQALRVTDMNERHTVVEYNFGDTPSDETDDDNDASASCGGQERVVMLFDDAGKAMPMPMGKFYYDKASAIDDTAIDSEEEDDNLKRASDTERANKPACLVMASSRSQEFGDEYDDELLKERNASEYETDTDCELSGDDSDGQFMRIQVPAAPLKDVDRVQKDTIPDPTRKASSRGRALGDIVRALSSVKIGIDSGKKRELPSDNMNGDRSPAAERLPVSAKEKAAIARAAAGKSKSSAGSQSRQAISSVGRMLSFTTEKKLEQHLPRSSSTCGSASLSTYSGDPLTKTRDRQRSQVPQSEIKAQPKRQNLTSVGKLSSLSNTKESSSTTPLQSISTSPASQARGSMGASAGRMDSQERSRAAMEGPSVGSTRAGIAHVKLCRLMSFSRKRHLQSTTIPQQPEPDTQHIRQLKVLDQLSETSIGSRTRESRETEVMSGERNRLSPGSDAVRKDGSRMGLKAASRLLSFSRRPASNPSTNPKVTSSTASASSASNNSSNPQITPLIASPRLDGRANKFFFSEINSESVKSCDILHDETHIRIPVLVMAEYSGPVSKNKWFIDAFTLPHNAVRRECMDLYEILMALARCRGETDITRDDMADFYMWWTIAEQFFKCYFDMERTVLFRWIDEAGAKDWELQMALGKMRSMKDGLQQQLQDISNVWRQRDSFSAAALFAMVYKATDTFCPRLMNYFADQELLLPTIVKSFYRIEDRLVMDKDMLGSFMGEPLSRRNKDLAHHNLILLVRWIANPRQLRAWIAKNLNSIGRTQYSKWHAMYEAEHISIVKTFRNRSKFNMLAAMSTAQ
jgi:hypothetical protein